MHCFTKNQQHVSSKQRFHINATRCCRRTLWRIAEPRRANPTTEINRYQQNAFSLLNFTAMTYFDQFYRDCDRATLWIWTSALAVVVIATKQDILKYTEDHSAEQRKTMVFPMSQRTNKCFASGLSLSRDFHAWSKAKLISKQTTTQTQAKRVQRERPWLVKLKSTSQINRRT